MKKIILIVWVILTLTSQKGISTNAPISTAGIIVSTETTAIFPVTALNFTNIGSFNLKLLYDPGIVSATSVTISTQLGGNLTTNLTVPGTIILGWYTYPGKTLSDNSVLFNISFTKVTYGTSAIAWSDNGYSCSWYDGGWNSLYDLPTPTFYQDGSITFPQPLIADFSANNTTPPKNITVQFNDLTSGGPTSWDWSFDRTSVVYVNGTSHQSQNPQVQFTDGGLYTVTLIAHNAYYNDTKVKTGYIQAGTPGQWTGSTSTSWMTGFNWETWSIPDNSTDVVISPLAPNWPVFAGDLLLGSSCRSITINGSSQVIITGNFTINAGSSLTFTNDGILRVGGDWVNNGVFNAGIGTVDFTGPNSASILPGNPPSILNVFNNLTLSKTLSTLHIIPNINVNGNLMINP